MDAKSEGGVRFACKATSGRGVLAVPAAVEATSQPLFKLLTGPTYDEVPPYQRDYSWEVEQTTRLLADVIPRADGRREPYFLGAMVFVRDDDVEEKFEVLDGQQRYATLLLLLRALEEVLRSRLSEEALKRMTVTIGAMLTPADSQGRNNGESFVHLRLNDADREYFETVIKHGKLESPTRGSHKLIKGAYERFLKFFQEAVPADAGDAEDYWIEFKDRLVKDLYIIRVDVSAEIEAQELFEALNSAGMDLTAADLVKNLVLRTLRKEGSEGDFKQGYDNWRSAVEDVGDKELPRFLRVFWNSKYGFAREARLYRDLRSRLEEEKSKNARKQFVKGLLADLSKEAQIWSDLQTKGQSAGAGSSALRDDLQDLQALDAKLVYVPLLAWWAKHDDQGSRERVARLLRDFFVRHTIVGKRAPNEVEELYSQWAMEIRSGSMTEAKLQQSLERLSPSNEEFKAAFKALELRKLAYARVLLARLNDSQNRDNSISKTIIEGKEVHVEHIIPQQPEHWAATLKGEGLEHGDVVDRIANLTLLVGKRNIAISNKPFQDKKPEYSKSGAPLNAYLAELDKFGKVEIEVRAARLAEWAERVWTLELSAASSPAPKRAAGSSKKAPRRTPRSGRASRPPRRK